MKNHKTGYVVWIYSESYWHRTEEGARRHAQQAQCHCTNVQIIECATGKLISGRPE